MEIAGKVPAVEEEASMVPETARGDVVARSPCKAILNLKVLSR